MRMKNAIVSVWALSLLGFGGAALGVDSIDLAGHVPDEYEAVGGHATGLGNSGAAALGGFSAVRVNPAILPFETQYSVNGSYSWPTSGREFYHVGVVDSSTSQLVAAGLSYTGFRDPYVRVPTDNGVDAPIDRRVTLALAHGFQKVSLGISGQFVVGYDDAGNLVKGNGLGFGIAALLAPPLRVGASVENAINRNVEEFAPRTIRAGLAYLTLGGSVSLNLDYRQRQRVEAFEGQLPLFLVAPAKEPDRADERMIIPSVSTKVYDVLRLTGAYGQELGGEKRRILAAGIGLVHDGFALTYCAHQPYLNAPKVLSAVNLSLMVAL